jgi:hypothetical protein
LVPVSGKVLIDGQPLTRGLVTIHPEGHRQSIANIEPDGSFKFTCYQPGDGTYTGTHVVCVTACEEVDATTNRWHAPQVYANRLASELRATIDGPRDDLEINLTWQGSNHDGPYLVKF